MKPYNSSSNKENCSPISSNCVIWQGPNISCINLCKGDSVSDIVYKLGQQLCDFQNTASLSDLQLDCLLDICTSTPKPELTLAAVLQLIIDKICCSFGTLTTAVNTINTGRPGGTYEEPVLDLPVCLQYNDPVTGLPITTLTLSAYVVNMANQFCALKATVDTHTIQIANHETRITELEDAPCCYIPPTLIPHCSYGSLIEGIPAEMNVVLDNLDDQYCQLRAILGTNSQLVAATSSECSGLGGFNALSQPGTMSSITGWNNTVSSFAQSMQNLWLTVCDMRGVINDLKNCCGASNCSSFFLGFSVGSVSSSYITLLFNSFTVIPAGYSNCPTLSSVTITDGNGHTYTSTFDLVGVSTDPAGNEFDISSSGLDTAFSWTITVTGCIINSAGTCTKIVTNVIPAPVPTTTTTTLPQCTNYSVYISEDDITHASGNTNPAQNGKVYVVYVPCGYTSATTNAYSSSGSAGAICVNPLFAPYLYIMVNDVMSGATSSIISSGACSTT